MKKFHLIGIGGIGLSALARHLLSEGYAISGSDGTNSKLLDSLAGGGAKIHIGHDKKNIPTDCDGIIYSLAIPDENSELLESKKRNLQIWSYPQALGFFTKDKKNICITGTHGKTTTTGMIGKMLMDAKKDPTIVIGTTVKEWENKNYVHGKSDVTVMESCEYKRAFLNFSPWIVIITNIDLDHLDYFKDKNDYDKAFQELVEKIPTEGAVIYHPDDASASAVAQKAKCQKIPATGLDFDLEIPGLHNRKNATLAVTLGKFLKIPNEIIKKSIQSFRGIGRRFELKGLHKGKKVFDDYGHHPVEIRATLQAAREQFPDKKLLLIYQPHQYSRTQYFIKEFSESFSQADAIIIPDIYEARDSDEVKENMSVKKLVEILQKNNKKVFNINDIKGIEEIAKDYDIIMTMGAGDVWKITDQLIKN